MPNEFVTRNGFISLNSSQITGSLTVTQGVTASLFGTSSWSSNAVTSSNSLTASFVLQTVSSSFATSASFATTASFAISASFSSTASSVNILNQPVSISGSFTVVTGSGVEFQVTNTGVKIGNLASDFHTITGSIYQSGSSVGASLRGSGSAIFSVDGTVGRLFQVDDSLSGSLFSVNTAAGLPIIEAFSDNTVRIAQFGQRAFFVSQSVVGIGKESLLNGKLDISGSTFITGSLNVSQGITGSLFGTSSWAQNVISSSFAATASLLLGSVVSSSYALTASFALNAGGSGAPTFPFTGSAIISGSLQITGSFNSISAQSVVLAASGGFSKSFAIINNSNISAIDVGTFPIWRCNVPCTASMVLGYTDAGSSVLVNATKNGSSLLSSDLSISTNTWVSSSTLQNQNFNTGDILAFVLTSFSGTPKEITIQTSFIY
jgi:hypothetical protein